MVGKTVGYKIRLESSTSNETILTFCTPGILLRSFADPSFLRGVTHLILDEVHERDKFCDFVLGYLRHERQKLEHLKIIVMSAGIDVRSFSEFFNACPLINVQGRMFPVEVVYLGDVLRLTEFSDDISTKEAKQRSSVGQKSSKFLKEVHELLTEVIDNEDAYAASKLVKMVKSGKIDVDYLDTKLNVTILGACASRLMVMQVQELINLGADLNKESGGWKVKDLISILDPAWVEQLEDSRADNEGQDSLVTRYIKTVDIEKIDALLIFKLIKHIHLKNSNSHGILVFLPGYEDIKTLKHLILRQGIGNPSNFRVYCLHSTIEADQRNVFKPVPKGVRKIILSTNIAETSLTVRFYTRMSI